MTGTSIPIRHVLPEAITPSPDTWELVINGSYSGRGPEIVADNQETTIAGFQTTIVANLDRGCDRKWKRHGDAGNVEAIARLLYAAPKLLAACRSMLAVEFANEQEDEPLHAALQEIRSAIAAAEDRSPIPKAEWLDQ